jgi:PEP-CTERM motif
MKLTINVLGAAAAAFAINAHAGPVYDYTGNFFTQIFGSAPMVTTSDRVTAWVEFGTAATPGQVGKSDVIAWSISDGVRTLSSGAGSVLTFASFDFDVALGAVDWDFRAWPIGDTNNANVLSTRSTNLGFGFDFSRLDGGSAQTAFSTTVGSWALRGAQVVPEPGSVALAGLALLLAASLSRRKAG